MNSSPPLEQRGLPTASAEMNAEEDIQGPHRESDLKKKKNTFAKKNSEKILIILSRDMLVQSYGTRQWIYIPTQIP